MYDKKKKKKTFGDVILVCEVCKVFEDVVFEFRCEWCSICILCILGVGVRGFWFWGGNEFGMLEKISMVERKLVREIVVYEVSGFLVFWG